MSNRNLITDIRLRKEKRKKNESETKKTNKKSILNT